MLKAFIPLRCCHRPARLCFLKAHKRRSLQRIMRDGVGEKLDGCAELRLIAGAVVWRLVWLPVVGVWPVEASRLRAAL